MQSLIHHDELGMQASSPTCHVPVLLSEIVSGLQPAPGKTIVDGTLGGGGHTGALAAQVSPGGRVIALDLDPDAIARAQQPLAALPVELVEGGFADLPEILASLSVDLVDGVVLDLGLSSDQLADTERGFSFLGQGPLDLRFNPLQGQPAWQLLSRLREKPLADLIYQFGEERYSRRIAKRIVASRRESPIRTADQLAQLVRSCIPRRRNQRIDPATRTFQALRIAVNDELVSLKSALDRLPDCLAPGGRLAVISFHSLEDRLVKHSFREDERLEVLTRRPIRPTEEESERNPRSRSAKLRIAQRKLRIAQRK